MAQRLSVSLHSMQRSSVVAGVTQSFASRLAGSFSLCSASPDAIAKALRQRNVSVSRGSRASVMRAEPSSHVTSAQRAQGVTSPSFQPSSFRTTRQPPQQQPGPHSRLPSTDHSHLQLSATAPMSIRVSAGSDDGPPQPQPQPPLPAALVEVEDALTPRVQQEVSRSGASRLSKADSVSSASSRQSEVEQAAQRLRALDQELMTKKPSVMLHPITKRLSVLQREQQQQQQREAERRQQEQLQPEAVQDERTRGLPIESPPTYTVKLDSPPPANAFLSSPDANPLSPSDPSAPADPALDPALSDPAAPPPATGCGAFIAATISSLIFSIVYLPFTVAILTQSVVQRRPILPINWQKELTGKYWLFSFSLFGFLFCFPFILVFGLLADTGIWSVFNNNVRSAIPFTMLFALYLSLFVMLHVATYLYAQIRADLSEIHSKTRQYHLNLSTLLCTAAIVFEAFQLISPFTSTASLGLHKSSADATDSARETEYRSWLDSVASVAGVGEWQVSNINTFLETFWIAFSIVIVYAFALGYGIQSNMQPSHFVAPVLFELIPGTFYLSIVGRLFRIFDCSPNGDGTYTLTGNSSVHCWDNYTHRSMCMAAFMGLLFYSSSAMFVACYRGDASGGSGVKFKPVYLVLERTLRDLFAMTTSLISNQILSRAMSFPVLLVLMIATYRMQPCSIPTLTRLKVLAQASAVWLLSLSFLADMFRSVTDWFDVYVPGLLVWGWGAGVAAFALYEAWCYYRRWERRQERRHAVAVDGLRAVEGLQLADDDDESEIETAIELAARDSIHKGKDSPILAEAALRKAVHAKASHDKSTDSPQPPPTRVAIKIDAASPSSSASARGTPRVDVVSEFVAPVSTTPSSMLRNLNIKQQAIRHTQASAHAQSSWRESVLAQPNMVSRGSVSTPEPGL